jgi:hypothetical protein
MPFLFYCSCALHYIQQRQLKLRHTYNIGAYSLKRLVTEKVHLRTYQLKSRYETYTLLLHYIILH